MSPAAVAAARKRHQAAHQALRSSSITIGTTAYTAAVTLGPVRREPLDDGSGYRYVQRATIRVLKTLLTTPPVQGTVIRLTPPGSSTALDFTLIEVGDQSPGEVVHVLHAMRLPPRP